MGISILIAILKSKKQNNTITCSDISGELIPTLAVANNTLCKDSAKRLAPRNKCNWMDGSH